MFEEIRELVGSTQHSSCASARTHTRTGLVHCVVVSRITPGSRCGSVPVVMRSVARGILAVRVILRSAQH
jgi:uncharacterized membrane protein YraQ (UPF0718 family)